VGRSSQAGMVLASAAAAKSFERTLMPRTTRDQGVITGLSIALVYSTTAIFQDLIENSAEFLLKCKSQPSDDRVRRATMVADLAAVAGGATLQRLLSQQQGESLGRGATRTAGYFTMMAGMSGFAVGFVQDLLDILDPDPKRSHNDRTLGVTLLGGGLMALVSDFLRRRAERIAEEGEPGAPFYRQEWNVQVRRSLVTSSGVVVALGGIAAGERLLGSLIGRSLERGLMGSSSFWRMFGHVGALGAMGALAYAGLDRVYQTIEAGTGKIEPAFDKIPESPFVSGSQASLVPWRTLGREGRRHVITALSRDAISAVMGRKAVADPIRVYVGLESGGTEAERVALAVRELERTGAFDRELLVAVSPTGTGYVNYAAVECCEYMTLGNCATVTLQYSKRPSPLSLDRVWEGRKQFRLLLAAIRRELYKRNPEHRPRLVLFGESLGAHTSQDAFLHQGTQALDDAGVERALWIGSPHLSKWRAQVMGVPRIDVEPASITDVNDFGEVEKLAVEEREKLRYVMITHHNDAVGLFGVDLVIQKPPWLGERELRSAAVPKWMRWAPIITAVQTVIDMKNAMNLVPGEFVANGHDYRADLARFIRQVYSLDCSNEQLSSIEVALRQYEMERERKFIGKAREGDATSQSCPPPESPVGSALRPESIWDFTPVERRLLLAVAGLNVASSKAPWTLFPFVNVLGTVAVQRAARRAGLTMSQLGTQPAAFGKAIAYGLAVAVPAALTVQQGARLKPLRGFYRGVGASGHGPRRAAYEMLVRIPLVTAVSEELIFRSALLGLLCRRRPRWVATMITSILFGFWHVLPSLKKCQTGTHAARDWTWTAAGVAISVGVTACAGVFLSYLRFASSSVLAACLVHAAANCSAYAQSRILARRREQDDSDC
jgi:uncharacterized membrane protein/membrane protease YdiL (CAAX protease family)